MKSLKNKSPKEILLIGSDVIGSVYATLFAHEGHHVGVLSHGLRTEIIEQYGLQIKDVSTGKCMTELVKTASDTAQIPYDLVIVAVRSDQLSSTFESLRLLIDEPHIVFIDNNPDGHKAIPSDLPGTTQLAFPGVSGSIVDNCVHYLRIDQQPNAIESCRAPMNDLMHDILIANNFAVQDIANIDGWLAYHAVFISCVSASILHFGGSAAKLGANKYAVKEMCKAITEGFIILRSKSVGGASRNLKLLHNHYLSWIAMSYWGTLLRSPKGELYFATHARHAPEEVASLAAWVIEMIKGHENKSPHLQKVLKLELHTKLS